ncbi:unnamed protein product [Colias eurytheme]|nr:unnamed protein product [Colias eurytheme]
MSSSHKDFVNPADFLKVLYEDEEEEYQGDVGNSDVEDYYEEGSGSQTPDALHYLPKRESMEGRSDLRERSRSPIWLQASESAPRVVVRNSDEDRTPLEAEDPNTFLTADAHTIFISPNLSERRSGRRSGRRGGRRVAGDRGGRVRSVRGRGQGRRGPQWQVGHPLNEIWVTDDDVPDELRNMVMDVINSRMQGRDRNRPERGTESENEDDDEFFDADECRDFEWASMESFQGKEETFLPAVTGSTQSNYVLDKDICIDESLTLWKGRSDIKQYIRSKASKFGIKTFELCESVTGYLWSFIVYTGKQSSADLEQTHGVCTTVVKKLMAPLLGKGYRLFMDNWYNSPLLARFLKRNGTDLIGTLTPSRRDVPVLINKAPLKRGEIIARHSGDVSVLSWQDKKRITMISTCHGSYTALPRVPSKHTSRPVPFKPQVVLDYNKFMGGVDLKDQMLEPYLLERKRCQKWHMKLFKRLLNVSILNSRILLQSSTNKVHDHLAFRLQLVDSILAEHLTHCPQARSFNVSSSRSQHQELGKLIPVAHWPTLLSQTGGNSAENRNFRKRCVVCLREGRKTIKTTFSCETCGVPLCIQNCFKSYHTS